jgi:hypothetical protein
VRVAGFHREDVRHLATTKRSQLFAAKILLKLATSGKNPSEIHQKTTHELAASGIGLEIRHLSGATFGNQFGAEGH